MQVVERDEIIGSPQAVVGVESGIKFFVLVQRVKRPASSKNMVVLRCDLRCDLNHGTCSHIITIALTIALNT